MRREPGRSLSADHTHDEQEKQMGRWIALCMLALLVVTWRIGSGLLLSDYTLSFGLLGCLSLTWLWFSQRHRAPSFGVTLFSLLSFSASFGLQVHHTVHWWLPALLVATGIVLLLISLPRIDTRILPAAMMGLAFGGLIWAASEYWIQEGHTLPAWSGLIGSLLLFGVVSRIFLMMEEEYVPPTTLLDVSGFTVAIAMMVGSLLG